MVDFMKKLELKDFLNYKYVSDVAYAPNGKAAAYIVTYSNEEENSYEGNIWVYENGQTRQLTALGKERGFFWEDDTHILFAAIRSEKEKKREKEKEQFTAYYRIDIHGGEATPAFTFPFAIEHLEKIQGSKYLASATIDANYPDYYKMTDCEKKDVQKVYEEENDYEVLDETPFWFNGGGFKNKKRNALFIVDVQTLEAKRITEPLFDRERYAIIGDKVYYTGSCYQCKMPRHPELYEYDFEEDTTKCLYENGEYSIQALQSFDGELYMLASTQGVFGLNENPKFYKVDIETGEITLFLAYEEAVGSSVGSDCRMGGGTAMDEGCRNLYFITTRRNSSHIYSLDKAGVAAPVLTEEGSIDCLAISKENEEILFVGMLQQKLQELYKVDAAGTVTQLTHLNEDALKEKYVAVPEKINIVSQGTDIDGWILKPMDYKEDNTYPAILDIHGGPKTVYGEVFYHEMQVWANQGYFVFFCNPTGSDGRGNEFGDIRGKYGTIDYDNIMDFTDAVLERYPQIDKKRVGVTGGSYGGFMTNWIVGHTERFAAAATQRSISNWISFSGVSDIGPLFAADQTGGDIYENMEKMWEHSPLKYAQNVTTPLLFIHSNEDYRCPMEQGMQFYTALADQGNLVRMCYFKGENHELSRSGKPRHRVKRLTEIGNWMDKFLKR